MRLSDIIEGIKQRVDDRLDFYLSTFGAVIPGGCNYPDSLGCVGLCKSHIVIALSCIDYCNKDA